LAHIAENWHTAPSFCVLAFHNGREDRNKKRASGLTPTMNPLRLVKIW